MPALGILSPLAVFLRHGKVNMELLTGHGISLEADSQLARLLGVSDLDSVRSFHGQAVGRLGEGVRVVATGDGGVVEAVEVDTEDPANWLMGVQWHPEMAPRDEVQNRLFKGFVEAARTGRRARTPR